MKSFIFGVLFVLAHNSCCCADSSTVDVFEFGNNEGHVAFTKSGKIGVLEKNVDVPIILPYCMELRYVRVDVDNAIGPPKVDFDADVNTVRIRYRRGQFSISSYTVTAKAVQSSICGQPY
ncbi:uncharacterized protein LOC123691960 [Colias croceus]|uniref:uncharacterized protein LOC123691960 n=1 Tax=Colias crocea TaxID=72248 RepID=UPI001E27B5C3|nr:uncharacterized protein LOC123691960 [Colias croceus]